MCVSSAANMKFLFKFAFINILPHSDLGHVASTVRIGVSLLRRNVNNFSGKLFDYYEIE